MLKNIGGVWTDHHKHNSALFDFENTSPVSQCSRITQTNLKLALTHSVVLKNELSLREHNVEA